MGGQGSEDVEHEVRAVAVQDGELGLRPHVLEDAPVVGLAEAPVLVLGVQVACSPP